MACDIASDSQGRGPTSLWWGEMLDAILCAISYLQHQAFRKPLSSGPGPVPLQIGKVRPHPSNRYLSENELLALPKMDSKRTHAAKWLIESVWGIVLCCAC